MRSAGVAWLLDLYGFKVYTIIGGYKAYRKWALAQFEKKYPVKILGGYTGSGKTLIIEELEKKQRPVINLEKIAGHRGSAFGNIGMPKQPSQELFENTLALYLYKTLKKITDNNESIWLEDESQRIGDVTRQRITGSDCGDLRVFLFRLRN